MRLYIFNVQRIKLKLRKNWLGEGAGLADGLRVVAPVFFIVVAVFFIVVPVFLLDGAIVVRGVVDIDVVEEAAKINDNLK